MISPQYAGGARLPYHSISIEKIGRLGDSIVVGNPNLCLPRMFTGGKVLGAIRAAELGGMTKAKVVVINAMQKYINEYDIVEMEVYSKSQQEIF